jgi:HD-GYP domain-containing protein (c-di-GMP phosphodiesterase class II)
LRLSLCLKAARVRQSLIVKIIFSLEAEMEHYGKQAYEIKCGDLSLHSCMEFWSSMQHKGWPEALEAEGWSETLCLRNKESEEHTLCVAEMTVALAKIAAIPECEINYIRSGALLHDVGKVGVPETILLKPGRLSRQEWEVMRKHPDYAYDLIYPIEYLRPCLSIPYSHHEKWNGTGYPQGLKGEEIPLPARIFAIVDVWETLSTDRIYREAWPEERVMGFIQQQSGTHFDPEAVEMFLYAISTKTYINYS